MSMWSVRLYARSVLRSLAAPPAQRPRDEFVSLDCARLEERRVLNGDPVIAQLNVTPNATFENGTVLLNGRFNDTPATDATSTVIIDWGDGSTPTEMTGDFRVFNSATRVFAATHRYLDDNPTGTPSDLYTITVTVLDGDGGSDTESIQVRVTDLAPVATSLDLDQPEDQPSGTLVVSGSFVDVGTLDTHTLTVDWGDGQTSAGTIDSVNREFSASHQYDSTGTYLLKFTLTDDDARSDTFYALAYVEVNNPPTVAVDNAAVTIDEGQTATNTGTFGDPDEGDTVTLSASVGTIVDNGDGTWSWSYSTSEGPDDSQTVTIRATDSEGEWSETTFDLTVNNVAPTIDNLTATPSTIDENETVTLTGSIVDPSLVDSHTVLIDWGDGNSSYATVDAETRTFTATHQYLDDNPSDTSSDSYTISATVTDDDGDSGQASTTVTVDNVAPTISGLTVMPTSIDEDGTVTVTGSIVDPGTLDTHTVSITWGDGTTSLATVNAETRTFTATHQYLDDDPSATTSDVYTITAKVTDDDGEFTEATTSVTVDNVAPSIDALTVVPTSVDEDGSVTVTGSIVDPGTLDTHTVQITWGDGTTSYATVDARTRTFTATHQYLDDNPSTTASDTYTITADITDDDGGTSSASTSVTVKNVAPEVAIDVDSSTINEDGSITLTGQITDVGTLDTHTVVINWGDGTSSNAVVDAETRTFSATHQYLDDNPTNTSSDVYTIDVTVTDDDTGVGTAQTSVTVNNVAPTVSINVNPATINEDGSVTLSGTVTDVGTLDTHSVVINWGDGNSSTVTVDAGTRTFTATHQYLDDNPTGTTSDIYTIGVTVTDDDAGAGTEQTTVTVHNIAPTVSINVNPATLNEDGTVTLSGTITDVGTLDTHTVVINWGDGTSSNAVVNTETRTFTATHKYLDDNPSGTTSDTYTIDVTVTDDDKGVGTAQTTVAVDNVAPTVSINVNPAIINENGSVTLSGTITDVGTLDTHTVVIHWGDGSSSNAVVNTSTRTFTATHQYLDDNPSGTTSDVYTIDVTVTDDDAGVGTAQTTVTVNNVTPTVTNLLVSPSTINENGSVTVTGTIIDAGTLDSHTVQITWGDGSTSMATVDAQTRTFTATHQYLDDNPSGTPSDVYIITAAVTDDDGSSSSTQTSVTVNNVVPVISGLAVSPTVINENGSVTVTGTIVDTGTLDTHTVTITWGDGSTSLATIDASTRTFTATHQYLDDEPTGTLSDVFTITAVVADDDGGTSQAQTSVTVNNVAPVINGLNVNPTVINENGTVTVTGTIVDPGTLDTHTVEINWGDGSTSFATVDASTRTFTATHQYLDDNPSGTASDSYTIRATVVDDDDGSSIAQTSVTVRNVAPTVAINVNPAVINEDGTVTLTGQITDVGSLDTHTVHINWGDGTNSIVTVAADRTFTATHQYVDDNPTLTSSDQYTVLVTVTDDDTGVGTAQTTVTVNNVAPTVSINVNPTVINEDGSVIVTGSFTDPGRFDTHTVVVNWGDGTSSVATLNAETRTFTATHKYLDDNPSGTASDVYTIQVNVTDDDSGVGTAQTTVTVNNVAPTVAINVNPTVINEDGSVTLSGTITDIGKLDTHSVVINWGDGNSSIATVDVETRTFTATHQYLDDNPTNTASDVYTIDVTVTDDDMGVGTAQTTVTVNNVAPTVAININPTVINEDGSITLSGTVTDVGTLDTHTVVINWGDGNSSIVTVDAATRTFTATHQYLDDNPTNTASDVYTIDVTVTDDDTGVGTAQTTVTVNNVAPTVAINVNPTVINEDGSVTLSGTVTDVGTLDTHTVVINWGDGNSSTVTVDAETRTFTATHQYLDDNPTNTASDIYTIDVTVTDDDTGVGTAQTTVTVNNVAPTVAININPTVINEDGSITLSGTVTDVGTLDTHTVVINWGDGNSSTVTVDAETRTFTATHQYLDDNPTNTASDVYTIDVTVTDDDTGIGTAQTSVTVNNVAPTVAININPTVINENGSITLSGTVTDVGTLDTHSVVINWGDGTSSTATVDAETRTFTATHQYIDDNPTGTASDTYTIGVTVTDDDTGIGATQTSVTVNNVAPTGLVTLDVTEIDENGSVTVTGTVGDVGTLDTHTVVIAWGDGTTSTATVDPTTRTFTATHQYLDDDPTATSVDIYTIVATITDDDTGVGTAQTTVTVNNVVPSISGFSVAPPALDENGLATLNGTVVDIGSLDTHTVTINWGDGTTSTTTVDPTTGAFTATHQYAPGVGSMTINVTLADDDGGTATAQGTVQLFTPVVVTPTDPETPEETPTNNNGAFAISSATLDVNGRQILIVTGLPPNSRVFDSNSSNYVTGSSDGGAAEDEVVLLEVIAPDGSVSRSEILPKDVLKDLPGYLQKLPGGHYRLHLVSGTYRRPIIEVHIRDHQIVDPQDLEKIQDQRTSSREGPANNTRAIAEANQKPAHPVNRLAQHQQPVYSQDGPLPIAWERIPDGVWQFRLSPSDWSHLPEDVEQLPEWAQLVDTVMAKLAQSAEDRATYLPVADLKSN